MAQLICIDKSRIARDTARACASRALTFAGDFFLCFFIDCGGLQATVASKMGRLLEYRSNLEAQVSIATSTAETQLLWHHSPRSINNRVERRVENSKIAFRTQPADF